MNWVTGLSWYLSFNLLVAAAYVTLTALRHSGLKLPPAFELRIHYYALLALPLVAVSSALMPQPKFFEPPAKVWIAPQASRALHPSNSKTANVTIGAIEKTVTPQFNWLWFPAAAAVFLLLRDLRSLHVLRRRSFILRRIGGVEVLADSRTQVPFSFWWGQACVVIPLEMPVTAWRIAIAHELQHHRQGDTKFVYVVWLMTRFLAVNPAIWFWSKRIQEVQEFACDAALVDRRKVESHAYARCLLEVAQSAVSSRRLPVSAMGMASSGHGHLLRRRIENMFQLNSTFRFGRATALATAAMVTLTMGAAAYAGRGLVSDRRITLKDAQRLAAKMKANGAEFPVAVNESVVEQLNQYLGTAAGRHFIKGALSRMDEMLPRMQKQMSGAKLPPEIFAIPIIESGYQNIPQKPGSKNVSAGIWQFIPSTARRFGLVVDLFRDERLDVHKSTKAAFEYFQANHDRFDGDWLLALQAYNSGEKTVEEAIFSSGSRDAWDLIAKGMPGDENYLAKAMAAMLIAGNREIVE